MSADSKDIRFIDSDYRPLFTVPDGANIVMTELDGTCNMFSCQYIDDCHARIGDSIFHIHQFALVMEQRGAVYAPERPSATISAILMKFTSSRMWPGRLTAFALTRRRKISCGHPIMQRYTRGSLPPALPWMTYTSSTIRISVRAGWRSVPCPSATWSSSHGTAAGGRSMWTPSASKRQRSSCSLGG